MISDTLDKRQAVLGKSLFDKTVTKITVNINIVSTLPLMIMEDALLDRNVIDLTPIPAVSDLPSVKNILMDPTYTENDIAVDRFIHITTVTNPHTYFKYGLWYDKQFKDIIVLPGTETIIFDDDTLSSSVLGITGYRVGSGLAVPVIPDEMVIGMNLQHKYDLPVAKQNIASTMWLGDFHGLNPIHNLINNFSYSEVFQEKNGKQFNIGFLRARSEPVIMLDLGLADNLFENFDNAVNKLPLYMVYQQGITRYSFSYLGNVKPKNYRVCICLQF
jgi:hypothetical protein